MTKENDNPHWRAVNEMIFAEEKKGGKIAVKKRKEIIYDVRGSTSKQFPLLLALRSNAGI